MHFDLCQRRFTVAIAERPLFLRGEPSQSIYDLARGIIWLSDQLPKHKRRLKVLHELRHLWIELTGKMTDPEADADQAAEMMDAVMGQYNEQGGDTVLEKLEPEKQTSIAKGPTGIAARTRFECGTCKTDTMIGSVDNGAARWSADFGCWVIARWFSCEACSGLNTWHEACTAEGMPRGEIVPYPPPRVLRGEAARRWLAEHAVLCNA